MKKSLKDKSSFVPQEAQPDIAGLILKVQQQLIFLERKIDALIDQSGGKPFERERYPKPFQRFDRSQRHGEPRRETNYERILHKAICADCNKECEVPFRPSQDRPVYCKDCFAKRKGAGSFRGTADNRPRRERSAQRNHVDRSQDGEKKKFYEKYKTTGKRRKRR